MKKGHFGISAPRGQGFKYSHTAFLIMIDLSKDTVRNRLRRSLNPASRSPSTEYAERHEHLVNLYLDYLLTNYPPKDDKTGEK